MERKMFDRLNFWKDSKNRNPLLLQGARQVGKTYTALEFGRRAFANTVYLNFEGTQYLKDIFELDLEPHRIIRAIEAHTGQTILPEKTLIIFDEIQAAESALTSLKYFWEDAPEYCIIAAGSLLGVAINRNKDSFPVGKVDMITMYPLDFEEFLHAIGAKKIAGMINKCTLAEEGSLPLCAYADNSSFKAYMVDTGLLCSKFHIPANVILASPHSFDGFKGALAENYVMQALIANGLEPYYWTSDGTAELVFLFQDADGNIVPVEVKSADNVRSKSLHFFRQKYDIPCAYRISARNFGYEDGIKSVPLYAVFTIE